MKILLALCALTTSAVGGATIAYFIGVLLKWPDPVIVAIVFTAAVLSGVATIFYEIESEFHDGELVPFLVALSQEMVIVYLIRTQEYRRIRSDIKVFLSDKNPKQTDCPYDTHNTLTGTTIRRIWQQERLKRMDEILLLTDINS